MRTRRRSRVALDPEIERTLSLIQRRVEPTIDTIDRVVERDIGTMSVALHSVPDPNGVGSPINAGTIPVTNFEIKTSLINLLQNEAFHGMTLVRLKSYRPTRK